MKMRCLYIQLLICAAFFLWSPSAVAKRGSSVFNSEESELESLNDIHVASELNVSDVKENAADSKLFNDMGEEEFLENAILFDENGDLSFQPTKLYYNDCPLSITAAREFVMTNNMNKPVTVFTVRSNNRQFHSTLTKNQEIEGGGKLKVHILYLPQHVEFLTADLTIVTSRGEYTMPIAANSVENPYRVSPQLGIRFPAGHSVLETPIVVYNPHKETLQITEVFTTETYLSLKGAAFQGVGSDPDALPPVQPKATNASNHLISDPAESTEQHILWSIPPGTSKEIITLSIDTDLIPGFHSGFLHIKTDHKNLVMPVELQVLNTLVYAQHEEIKFGIFTSPTGRMTQDLWLNNNGLDAVQVLEIIAVDVDPNLEIEMVHMPVIYPGEKISSRVAKLHYTGKHEGRYKNKLLVMTNNTNAASAVVEVTYSALVLHGGIQYERALTLMSVEVYNKTYPFECSQCDPHGARLGYNDDLYAALLDEYYLKQNLQSQQQLNPNYIHPPTTTITNDNANPIHEISISDRPEHLITHSVRIGNYFDAPLVLLDVTFNSCEEFLYTDFVRPNTTDILYSTPESKIVVYKHEAWKPINITLKAALVYALYRENHDFLPKVCTMDLKTNISTHRVPIYVVSGALSIEYMDMPMIEDFGSLNVTALRSASTNEDETVPSAAQDKEKNTDKILNRGRSTSAAGDEDTSDVEIQFTDSGDGNNWQCDSPLCQSVNSDIFHIDMGNQSIHEPRLLRIVLVNNNPIQLPISLDYASHDACMCYETHWPIGLNSVEYVEPILTRAHPRNWIDSAKNKDFCMCLEPSAEEEEEMHVATVSNGKNEKKSHLPQEPTSYTVKSNQNTNSKFLPYGVEAQQSTVFTISLRDLKNCRVYPTVLRGFSNVAMSECRSGADAPPLVPGSSKLPTYLRNGERSSIRVDLHSQFQRLQLHLHFTARFARFRTSVAASNMDRSQGGVFVLGQANPLVVRTRSSFSESIQDFHYFVEPNVIYRIEHEASMTTNPVLKSWHTVVYAMNICSARSDLPLHDVNQVPLTSPPAEDESLRGTNLFRCQHSILTQMNYSDPNNSHPVIMSLLQKQDKYMTKMNTVASKIAHENAIKVKYAWATAFSHGIRMPPLGLHMLSPHTTHTHRMENLTLQSPQMFAPHSYRVKMPTIRVGQVQWFYLTVNNPFDTTVSFALLEDPSNEVTKRMKNLGGLYFLPQGLEEAQTAKPIRVNSRYQCPPLNLLPVVFTPCECVYMRNAQGLYQDNDTYCETDFAAPPSAATHPFTFDTIGVDEAAVQRSKSLSMIRKATQYKAPSTVLTGLDKIFPSENRKNSANAKNGENGKVHASEHAFLPQSTTENVWVVPPRTSARIGPILYGPQVQKYGIHPTTDVLSTFYLFNNFTGYDRIDVYTSSGNAIMELYAIGSCFPDASNGTIQILGHDTPNGEPVCSTGMIEKLVIVPPTPPDVVPTRTVWVESLYQPYHLYVRNSGEVGATVQDIILDDLSCLNPPKPPQGLWDMLKTLVFGPKHSPHRQVEINNICASNPQMFPGNATMLMYLIGPDTCAHTVTRRMISINLEKNPPGEAIRTGHDPSRKVSFEITFQFKTELVEKCLYERKSAMGWNVLRGFCVLALLAVLGQMLSAGVMVSFQRRKYLHVKQVKARRVRSPSSKRSASAPGSPPAISSTNSNDTAASIAVTASPLIPGESPAKERENEPRTVIPDKRSLGLGFDLSDVLIEEGAAEGTYSAERRDRESLGSEPTATGEWSTVRPKLRAVETLRQSRAATAAAASAAVPAMAGSTGLNVSPAVSTASPVGSPGKLSSNAPIASALQPVSPDKPSATPQKGPLQMSPAKPFLSEPTRAAADALTGVESTKKSSAPPGLTATTVPVAASAASASAGAGDKAAVAHEDTEVSSVETEVPVLSTSTSSASSEVFESAPADVETTATVAAVTENDTLSNSSSTDDASATPGPSVSLSAGELSANASNKDKTNGANGKKTAGAEAITPHTPATPVIAPVMSLEASAATGAPAISAVAETKEKKSRRDRIKAKEAKARAVAALETVVSLESTPSPANSAPTSARLSNSSNEAPNDLAGVTGAGAIVNGTAEASAKQSKTKGEKLEKVEKSNSKKVIKPTATAASVATPIPPASTVTATSTVHVASQATASVSAVPVAKGKPKTGAKVVSTNTTTAPAVHTSESSISPLKIDVTVDHKAAPGLTTGATAGDGANKPPLAGRGKLSPLRLPQPHSSSSHESRTTEDSPLFRYSGQLLDPSRGDSTAELNALPDFPTPMKHPLGPFPSLDDSERHLLGGKSQLADPLSQVLWPAKDDAAGHLGLDLDLGLDLTQLGYTQTSHAPLPSPDNILRAGVESELRVTADPFFSRKYDNPPAVKSSKTGTASSLRDRTTSASNYLNDLLSSAGGPFDDLDDFSLGNTTHTSSTTARGGKGGAREWWPSGALPNESLTGRAALHDTYFDLGHVSGTGGRGYPGGSPSGHWTGSELNPNELRRGPGYSPQYPEADLYGSHASAAPRFQPTRQPSQEDVYRSGPSAPPPLAYNGALQRETFYNRPPQAAGIYNEPQELSRPVFDRTDRGGRESDHARYHGAPQGGFESSPPLNRYAQPQHQPHLQHQSLPPQRHAQLPPQAHLQEYYDPHDAMSSHSYDFLGLDRVLDEDDGGGGWVRELSRSQDEHASGRDRRLSGGSSGAPFGYAPEPVFGGYGRVGENIPDQRAASMHVGSPPSGSQYMQNVGGNGQQQQLRRLEQLRSARHNQGAPPHQHLPSHQTQAPYGPPSSFQTFDMHGVSGFPDPFSRPEPVYNAPTDPETARWQALNNANTRQPSGDVRSRTAGAHAPLSQAMQGPPPGMQHLARPSGATPLAGYSMTQPSHSQSFSSSTHSAHLNQLHGQDAREQVFQPFGQDLQHAPAQERNFFHPQSFFGDAAGSLVSDVALEALEGEDDDM